MTNRLDFAIIGAQKCATSWIYYCQRDHPEAHLPVKKEEKVYLGGDLYQEYGLKWYLDHIGQPDKGKRVGDVSVDYLFDPRSPSTLKEKLPKVKLIASLRNPIDRAVSSYYWNLRRGNVDELDLNRGMRRVLEDASGAESLSEYDSGKTTINILARGLYDIQLQRYLRHFATDQILLIPYDAIGNSPEAVLKRIYRFIGVDEDFQPRRLTRDRRPKKNAYWKPLLALERELPNQPVFNRVADFANQLVAKLNLGSKQPGLSPELYRELELFYKENMRSLFRIVKKIDTDTKLWDGVHWLTGEKQ